MRKSILPGLFALLIVSALATCVQAQPRLTTIFNTTGGYPTGLSQGNGGIYTTAAAPTGGECGAVFELLPPVAAGGDWTGELLYAFAAAGGDACNPDLAPIPAPDGSLYGLANLGGSYGSGALYQILPPTSPNGPWTESVLCSIPLSSAGLSQLPASGLVGGPGGSFYFLAVGGDYGKGQLLQFVPPASHGGSWSVKQLYSFGQGVYDPVGPDWLIAGPGGSLYGLSGAGGNAIWQLGTVFQLVPPTASGGSWSVKLLYSFGDRQGDGGDPSSLVLAGDGTLYGATYGINAVNPNGAALAFQLSPPAAGQSDWTYTILRNFGGLHPDTTMLLHVGNLFVGTQSPTGGEIFELQPPAAPSGAWNTKLLYHFTNSQTPVSQLVMTPNGTLFGVTGDLDVYSWEATGTIYMLPTQ